MPEQNSKYKAVIFDLFGTLVDNYDLVGYASSLRETSSLLKLRHEDFMKLWNDTADKRAIGGFKTMEELLEHICRELDTPVKKFDINLAKMVRYDYISLSLTPRQYAVEILSEIKKHNYKVGLISVCGLETPELWPQTPFVPFFDVTLFSSVTGIRKPDPRVFQTSYEQLGVKPEDCLYVDDTAINLAAAAGAGMSAVLYRNPEETEYPGVVRPKEEWEGPAITSLPEIFDLLEG